MFGKIWNNVPSTNQVFKNVTNTVNNAGNQINKAVNDTGKAINKAANDTGKAINKAANDTGNYINNTANGVYGGLTGDFSRLHKQNGDYDNGNPDYECCLEVRIANTFGYEVTDIIEIGMEEWALEFSESYDGFCSNISHKDGYEGASGFNRLFWVKVNAPGNFKNLVHSFDKFVERIMKKVNNSTNFKGFNAKSLVYNTRSCSSFDDDWKEMPHSIKKLLLGIATGKVDAATAGKRLETEIGKKIEKKVRQKIEKKIKKIIVKQIVKISTKIGAKAAGKSLAKKIPGVGAMVGFGYGIAEICQGNYAQAGLEMGIGLASTIPGPGTALSLALDAAGASKEIVQECMSWYSLQEKIDKLNKQYN